MITIICVLVYILSFLLSYNYFKTTYGPEGESSHEEIGFTAFFFTITPLFNTITLLFYIVYPPEGPQKRNSFIKRFFGLSTLPQNKITTKEISDALQNLIESETSPDTSINDFENMSPAEFQLTKRCIELERGLNYALIVAENNPNSKEWGNSILYKHAKEISKKDWRNE